MQVDIWHYKCQCMDNDFHHACSINKEFPKVSKEQNCAKYNRKNRFMICANQSKQPRNHFKNVDGHVKELVEQNRWPVSKAFENQVMCDLEDGIIDFCALRDLLAEIDYSGIAVIEQDMYNKTAAYAYQTAKKNLQYLREIKMID